MSNEETRKYLLRKKVERRFQSVDIIIHPVLFEERKYLIPKGLTYEYLNSRSFLYNEISFRQPLKNSYFKRHRFLDNILIKLPFGEHPPAIDGILLPLGPIFFPSIAEVLLSIPTEVFSKVSAIELYWPQESTGVIPADSANIMQTDYKTCSTFIKTYAYCPSKWEKFKLLLDSI